MTLSQCLIVPMQEAENASLLKILRTSRVLLYAAVPADRAVDSRYEAANELATVTSQVNGLSTFKGLRASPSWRFPSILESPVGSLAEANA